jgi:hypothetical protein
VDPYDLAAAIREVNALNKKGCSAMTLGVPCTFGSACRYNHDADAIPKFTRKFKARQPKKPTGGTKRNSPEEARKDDPKKDEKDISKDDPKNKKPRGGRSDR